LLQSGAGGYAANTNRKNRIIPNRTPNLEPNIDRIVICQAALDAAGGGNYLEIGVSHGDSFMPIRARAKWGVDPAYVLTRRQLLKLRLATAVGWIEVRLFRMTSDNFFRTQGRWLARRGVDVALLDGLHSYAQTRQDVFNTLDHLKPGGLIVLHDCNPLTEEAATPAESYDAFVKEHRGGWKGNWNGDVWKVIVHLRSLRDDLDTVVLDCDHGVGIVRRGPNRKPLGLSSEQIGQMQYSDLERNRQELLGLEPPDYLWEVLDASRSERYNFRQRRSPRP
jgi:hypothetical protein